MYVLPGSPPGTSPGSVETNTTLPPVPPIDAAKLSPDSAWPPAEDTDTREVTRLTRSRTNTSVRPFVSPPTRLVASDSNATNRPSAEISGRLDDPLPATSRLLTDTSRVVPRFRSRT